MVASAIQLKTHLHSCRLVVCLVYGVTLDIVAIEILLGSSFRRLLFLTYYSQCHSESSSIFGSARKTSSYFFVLADFDAAIY